MASVNKVIIVGNLTNDPVVREAGNTKVAMLSVATNRNYKDSTGATQKETEYNRVSTFGKLADICEKYLHKASSVYIEGRLHTRKFTDKQGVERYQTEIIAEAMQFLDKAKE